MHRILISIVLGIFFGNILFKGSESSRSSSSLHQKRDKKSAAPRAPTPCAVLGRERERERAERRAERGSATKKERAIFAIVVVVVARVPMRPTDRGILTQQS